MASGEPTSTTDLQEGQLAEDAVGTPDRMEGGAGAELEVLEEEEEGPLEEEEEELPYDPIKVSGSLVCSLQTAHMSKCLLRRPNAKGQGHATVVALLICMRATQLKLHQSYTAAQT
jgi:hypothetical protein